MKLLIATGEPDSNGVRLILAGMDLGTKGFHPLCVGDPNRSPIGRCVVTLEGDNLYMEAEVPGQYHDFTPAIAFQVKKEQHVNLIAGRVDILHSYLSAVFLSPGPNKDPRIGSVRSQLEEARK